MSKCLMLLVLCASVTADVLVTEPSTTPLPHTAPTPPNFVIMLMDDMGWGDLGCFGEPGHETPYLDQMAREGTLVPAMYASAPLCSPSRAALLTGRLPVRNGFFSDNDPGRNAYTPQDIVGGIQDSELLLPELLKNKNYTSKIIGKWHLGHQTQYLPLNHGFDSYFGSTNCHFGPYDDRSTPNIPVYEDDKMVGRYYEDFVIKNGLSNYTQILTQEAVKFINSTKEPFFLYWSPDASHGPTYASQNYIGRSGRGNYGSAVRELDAGVGALLAALTAAGVANNTFVVFSSDNGAATYAKLEGGSNGPLMCGKETTFEGGMRVPGIFWWPGTIPANSVTSQVWSQMDFLPTFLELAGIDLPNDRPYDGIPLSTSLMNPDLKVARNMFFYRGDRLMAVRRGPYKMHIWTWNTSQKELDQGTDFCPGQRQDNITTTVPTDHSSYPILFNIVADPTERYQIHDYSQEYKTVVKQLRAVVAEHQEGLVRGEPQLNWCDPAVMNWAPPGCDDLGRCLPVPESDPQRCYWPH